MSEYPQTSWPLFGDASVPPPAPIPFASSPRNTPLPWGNYRQYYTPFPVAVANNVGSAAGSQQHPQQGDVYEANDPPHGRGMLSDVLKRALSERMAHPQSEVVAYHKESGDNGKLKITVTFETYGEPEI